MTLRFRPHHFLCTLGFEGKGYSTEFTEGYASIVRTLESSAEGDATPIQVVGSTDSICAPCPNRQGESCTTDAKIRQLDSAHSAVTGIKPGDRLTWKEAKQILARRMTLERFNEACAPCSWRSLGACERALNRLIAGSAKPESAA